MPSPDRTHEGMLEVQTGTSWLHTSAPSSWLTPEWVLPVQQQTTLKNEESVGELGRMRKRGRSLALNMTPVSSKRSDQT